MDGITITNTFPILSFEILLPETERKTFDFSVSEIYKEKDIAKELTDFYQLKKQEWIGLVGIERWSALDEEKRDFLIKTAGAIDLGKGINIKKAYRYYE
jgi:hypothetical protein